MYNGEDIREHQAKKALNILKGFSEVQDVIEKAKGRQVGEVHSNGKWVWTQIGADRYDWRVKKDVPKKEESKHNLKLDGTDNTDDVLAAHNRKEISSDHVRVHYAHQKMKNDEAKGVEKEVDLKKQKEQEEKKKRKEKNVNSAKAILSQEKAVLKRLGDNGLNSNHKSYKMAQQAFKDFKEVSKSLLTKYGSKFDLDFDLNMDYKYNSGSIQIGFNKYDLKNAFPKEYEDSSAGLASSQINNFAAWRIADILNKDFKYDNGKWSGSSYGHSGSYVYQPLVYFSDYGYGTSKSK